MTHLAFDPSHAEFSLVNALACARTSLLAYSDVETVGKTATAWGFKSAKAFTRGPNYGIVLCNRDIILIAFRGTDQWADWLTNLSVFFKRSPLGFVHRGFMQATASFWPELARQILEVRDNDQSIWITGHSLGGALALLASTKLFIENKLPIAGLYTFGQPPVGTGTFCSRFKTQCPFRYYRFVNHTDAVSDLPIMFREHVGDVIYFDTSGAMWKGEPPWSVSLLDHVRAPAKYGGLSQFLAHSMKVYVELIGARVSV